MNEVDKIVSAKRDYNDRPYEDQKIKTATVETFGKEYDEVKKI